MTQFPSTVRRIGVLVAVVALAATACGSDDDSTTTTTEAAAGAGDTELTITDVWARPAPDLEAMDRSAVYMVITGGEENDALVSASVPTDIAAVTELHETVAAEGDPGGDMSGGMSGDMSGGTGMDGDEGGDMNGGMMQMREVERIEVPAGGTVRLEPGGLHVMLLELAAPLTPGQTFEVTLEFEVAGERTVTAEVREP